jgi:hypothetical protein
MVMDRAALICEVVTAFQTAARRALAAGFDFVELHGAHGYLLHSFLSPIANRRTDEFGAASKNRMSFPLLVCRAIREIWPRDKPLFYRTSAIDNVEGGLEIDDTTSFAKALLEAGVDVLDCSSGGIIGPVALAKETPRPGFQAPFAAAVRQSSPMKTMAVGLIVDPEFAEHIIAAGKADLVANRAQADRRSELRLSGRPRARSRGPACGLARILRLLAPPQARPRSGGDGRRGSVRLGCPLSRRELAAHRRHRVELGDQHEHLLQAAPALLAELFEGGQRQAHIADRIADRRRERLRVALMAVARMAGRDDAVDLGDDALDAPRLVEAALDDEVADA